MKTFYEILVNPQRGQTREYFQESEKEQAIERTLEWKRANYDVRLYKISVGAEGNIEILEIPVGE